MPRLAALAMATAGAALILAGCSNGTGGSPAVTALRQSGSVHDDLVVDSDPGRASGPVAVGEEVDAGDRVLTAHHVGPVSFEHDLAQPSAGMQFYAADVEACATAGGKGFSLSPYEFEFQMPDNTRATAVIGWQEPALNHTELARGECVRGWITLEVPTGQTPAFLIYEELAVDGAKVTWDL